MCLDQWDKLISIIQKIIASAGIIIGAIWAYFNYFRGRINRPRLETNVSGKIIKHNETLLLIATIKIKNVGLSKIDIQQKGSGMRIIGFEKQNEVKNLTKLEGVRIKTVPILTKHSWIEPNETIEDVHTYILPNKEYYGINLDVRLVTKKIVWRFSSVAEIDNKENKKGGE